MIRILYIVLSATAIVLLSSCTREVDQSATPQPSAINAEKNFRDLNGNGRLDKYENPELPYQQRVEDVLSRLTIAQKIRLVTGTGLQDYENPDSRVPGAVGYTYPLEELGIPAIALADGPAGLRILPKRANDDATYYATAFPIATALASSWNTEVLKVVGEAMGNETLEYGVDILLAPGMNIHRNPLTGRNFEYFSEDPYLSGKLAAAMAKGAESNGIGMTLKHFVANNQETNRFLLDTIVSERALREIYLRGFEIAVKEAQPWAIMSSYNLVNGVYVPQSKALLTDVLRDEWNFGGLVMTDWWGGDNAVEQMRAGNDLIMPGEQEDIAELEKAIEIGDLAAADLDTNVRRVLQVILRSPSFARYTYSDQPDLKAHAQIARQAAAEGVVLLKNSGAILPLAAGMRRIAALGNTSYEFLSGGTGSGDVNEAYTVSLVDALEANDFVLDSQLVDDYRTFMSEEKAKLPSKERFFDVVPPIPEMPLGLNQLNEIASRTDVGLLTIGRNSGEARDRQLDGDFNLSITEREMLDNAAKAFHSRGKKLVVVLNIGNIIEMASWRDKVDAIVLPWQGGQEAGNAVIDVLTGKVNPSAKLATTIPMKYADVPSAINFPGEVTSNELISGIGGLRRGNPSRVKYEEGIFVGYRYFDTFDIEPAYEFGYGLSYTTFAYGPAVTSTASFENTLSVSLTVTNSGAMAGKEVVQFYLTAPSDKLKKPAQELKGFVKTRELAPGESQQVTLFLEPKDLASFDPDRAAWVAADGNYTLGVGASSRDIRSSVKFRLDSELVVEKTRVTFTPSQKLLELE